MAQIETVVGQHVTDSAAYRYKPPVYHGDVLLLQPKDRPSQVDHAPGWKTVVTGKLMTRDVDGHHDELLHRENAGSLGRLIFSYLDQTVSDPPQEWTEPFSDPNLLTSA